MGLNGALPGRLGRPGRDEPRPATRGQSEARQARANNTIAVLNALGQVAVRCSQPSGTVHVVLDVNGYFE